MPLLNPNVTELDTFNVPPGATVHRPLRSPLVQLNTALEAIVTVDRVMANVSRATPFNVFVPVQFASPSVPLGVLMVPKVVKAQLMSADPVPPDFKRVPALINRFVPAALFRLLFATISQRPALCMIAF